MSTVINTKFRYNQAFLKSDILSEIAIFTHKTSKNNYNICKTEI